MLEINQLVFLFKCEKGKWNPPSIERKCANFIYLEKELEEVVP